MNTRNSAGWLADQLPRPLAEQDFTRRFLGIFEEIAIGFRERADGFAYQLDPGIAAPEFVRWTAGWLGLQPDTGLDEARHRAVVGVAGVLFPWRGTAYALRGILEAMTGETVAVEDDGGVFTKGKAPSNTHTVTITLSNAAGLNEQRLLAMIRDEVPADAIVVLRVGKRTVREEPAQGTAESSATRDRTSPGNHETSTTSENPADGATGFEEREQ